MTTATQAGRVLPPALAAAVYQRPLWGIAELAELVGTTSKHLYTLIAAGKLRATRMSPRCMRIAADDAAAWLAAGRA